MTQDNWIEHDGGPCPVGPGTWLAVRFRGNPDPAKGVLRSHGFSQVFAWHHDGAGGGDIIAYKLEVQP